MNERVAYLRNLVLALRCDGRVSVGEREVLERVASELLASSDELQAAFNVFAQVAPEWSEIPRFSMRLRNLEDMAEVCLCDGELSAEERKLLTLAAFALGLSQEQANQVLREVAQRLGMV